MNESCLFLNVATPSSALIPHKAPLPVMLWIHGGGYKTGWTNDYDLPALVRASQRRVIVVSCSYRLNVFGFAASAALSKRTHGGQGSGSFGIMDQRLAMQWVRDHIAPFGGNGNDITIFGQSAGGNSVLNHLVQTDSAGLFTRAIIQSGTYVGALPMAQAEATFAATLAHARCDGSVACLLALDADALLAAGTAASPDPTSGFGPTVDGVSLTGTPLGLIEAGRYDKSVPVVRNEKLDF
jgi:para-nitrobenzyl esterase